MATACCSSSIRSNTNQCETQRLRPLFARTQSNCNHDSANQLSVDRNNTALANNPGDTTRLTLLINLT
eukprot:11213181-Lingulodinium_polyedra.AAC.1